MNEIIEDRKPRLTILGLGPGDPRLLTRQAWEILENAREIYLRTQEHPTVKGFPAPLVIHSFDRYYEESMGYREVYQKIIDRVWALSQRPEGMIYAVPGDPLIAEATVPPLIEKAREHGLSYQIVPGLSFIEAAFSSLGFDPLPQTSLLDALEVIEQHHPPFPPDKPVLIAQIYSSQIASELKLTLMAVYPDLHPVKLIHRAGNEDQQVEDLPLYAIDRSESIGNLTCLYLPPLEAGTSFEAFQEVIAHLRAPDGCPWDREQDHQSLRPHLLEETYELIQALDDDDPQAMREELGDLLLQVVLHAQIGYEYGEFTMAEVLKGIHDKLIFRHPHVFQDLDLENSEQVKQNWERLKARERVENGHKTKGILDGVVSALPALTQAQTIQQRVARVGFDWDDMQGVVDKVGEEIQELIQAGSERQRWQEMGDLLFALVNLARWLEVDAESALRNANQRFRTRFNRLEQVAAARGRVLESLSLEEMDQIWEEIKADHSADSGR